MSDPMFMSSEESFNEIHRLKEEKEKLKRALNQAIELCKISGRDGDWLSVDGWQMKASWTIDLIAYLRENQASNGN